jgi:beta-barrel assembly-enhancing protease
MAITLSTPPEQAYAERPTLFRPQFIIACLIAAFCLLTYFTSTEFNPITNQNQHLDMSPSQEISLGLESTPVMEQQYGGIATDQAGKDEVSQIGSDLIAKTKAGDTPYKFDFHLLADDRTVNAFALPGGQVFMTEGLFKLLKTRGQVACVLAHEVGHVVARHSAQQIAKARLTEGLTGATVIATYDPNDPNSRNTAALATVVGNLVNLKFSRNDELEADQLGVRFSSEAGFDPRAMIDVMRILQNASRTRMPEFFSTHPNPERRIERIKMAIEKQFPGGIPEGLTK